MQAKSGDKNMNKKGISLSMETIVVAAIALFVLIAVIFFFSGAFEDIVKNFKGISGCRGECSSIQAEGKNCLSYGCEKGEWCCTSG